MADIRLNLIADLGAFQGALASAVTQAKSTVAPVKISGEFDRQGWINAVRDAKAYLGKQLKTYKVTLEVDYDQSSLDRADRKLKSILDRNEKEVDYKVRLNFIAGDINTSLEKVREKFRTASPIKFQVEPYLTSNPEKGIQGLDAARKLIQDKVKGFGAAKFTVDVDTASIDSAANKLTNLKDSVDAVYRSFTDRTVGVSVDKTITGLQEAADALDRAFSNRTVQVGIDKTVQGLEDVGKALSAAFGNRTISLVVDETIRGLQEAKSVLASTFGDQLVNVVVSATDNVTAALEAIEAKIAAVAAAPLIRPSVDLSELVALNAELDKKQSHLSTVIKDFASSPIKPIVDTSNLDRLSKELDAIRAKIADAAKEVPVAPSVSASQGAATGGSSVAALKQLIQTSGRGETSMRRAGFDYVANALGVSPTTIEKVRPQLLKAAEGIGDDTAKGILVGLYEGTDQVEKGTELLGKKAMQALKDYLEIQSPSGKSEREGGLPLSQGQAVGTEKGIPIAEKAAEKLGESVIDRLKTTIKKGLTEVRQLLNQGLDLYAMEYAKRIPESALGATVTRAEAALANESIAAIGRDTSAELRRQAQTSISGKVGGSAPPTLREQISEAEVDLFNEAVAARQDTSKKLRQQAASTLSGAIAEMRSMAEINTAAQVERLKQEKKDRVAEARRRRDMIRSITDEEVALFYETSATATEKQKTQKRLNDAYSVVSELASGIVESTQPLNEKILREIPTAKLPAINQPVSAQAQAYIQNLLKGVQTPFTVPQAGGPSIPIALRASSAEERKQVKQQELAQVQGTIAEGLVSLLAGINGDLKRADAAQKQGIGTNVAALYAGLGQFLTGLDADLKTADKQIAQSIRNASKTQPFSLAVSAAGEVFKSAVKRSTQGIQASGIPLLPPAKEIPVATKRVSSATKGGILLRASQGGTPGGVLANDQNRIAWVKPEFLRFIREAAKAAPQLVQGVTDEIRKEFVGGTYGREARGGGYRFEGGMYRSTSRNLEQQIPVGRTLALPAAGQSLGSQLKGGAVLTSSFKDISNEAIKASNEIRKLVFEAQKLSQQRIGGGLKADLAALATTGGAGTDIVRQLESKIYSTTQERRQALRTGGAEGLATLGVEQTGGVDQQKKALAQVGAAYRAGVVNASDYRRAQLQVKMATIDATLPMKGLTGSLKDLGSQFGEATKDILFYGAAYQALGRIQELPRNIYEAVKAQDSFSNSLKATLGAGDTYGQQIQFLTQLSNKYGMNIAETRDGFVKLFASMRQANIATGDVNKLQEATAVIGTAFKLTPDKMDRVTYALGQMASKGQITSEELKGQLGDVLPGAVSQFAAAAGYTGPDAIAKFSKAMEDGTFKGERMRQILVKWAENTTKDFAPAALQAANSIQGLENRLANATTKVYESFSGAIGAIAPNIIYPLIADLGRLSDALDVVFGNTSKRLEQAKKNQEQLLSAQKTGIAPETNLELGFTKGERVKKLDVAKQLADTNVEVATLEGRLKNLSGNQAVQKLATDLQNAANALKNFFDGLTSVLGPIGSLLGTVLTASNSITLFGGSISGLAGAFVSATVILRVFTGLIGFLGLNLIKSNGLTRAAIPLFNILAATAGKTGVQIGLLNNGVLAFQRSAIQGGVAARGLAFGLNLIAKAGPLLIVSGIFYFFDKLGEYLDRNASKVRAFKDQIASLAGEELKLKKIEVGKEFGKAKTEFKGYPGGFAGYQRDLKRFEALQKKQRTDRGNLTLQDIAEGTTLAQRIQSIPEIARDRIEVLQSQLGEINNALVRENRVSERLKKEQEKARLEAEKAALLAQSQIGAGGDDSKGKGKGKGGGTPQAIGDDFASLMQRIQSDTLKAALEEQRYAFEGAISRLFPRGAGIFQPFVDAYKGVFDFLNDFQERQMQQMESATKTMVSGFRLFERNRTNAAKGYVVPIRDVYSRNQANQLFGGSRGHQGYDIGANPGTPVFAMTGGVVKDIYKNFNRTSAYGGKGLVIQGDDGVTYVYGHVEGITNAIGTRITAGQKIASVANLADQSHLHLEMRNRAGRAFDPRKTMDALYGGRAVTSPAGTSGGLSATTLTPQQQAQIKEAEKALAEQQKRTTAAMLQGRMQDLFNLFEEANLGDKFSKVSTALRDLQRRTEDFGFRAKEAFADFLPEGLKEARKAILSAQKDLIGAQREAEDLRLEFEQMMKQGGGVDRLIAGGLEALKDPQYKELVDKLNSMLALAGKGTLEQAFIAARGSASELRRILSGLGVEIEGYAGNLVTAAEAQKQIAEQTASLTERAASLGIQQQIFQAAGIQMSGLGGEQRRLELEGQIMSLQAGAALNPANAAAIQQRIADLRVLQKLNEDIGGGIATVGDIVSTTGEGFRKFTSDLLMGTTSFQESLVNLLNSFAQYLIDLSLRLATVEIVKSIFGAGNIFGSTSFGLFDTTGGGGGLGSFAGSMSGTWGASSLGGFNPSLGFKIPGFATGGVVTGPTIGLIGEGRYNEAVIPLPDGRSVPVDLGGSTGNQINTNITVNVNNGQAQTESGSSGSDLGRRLEGAVKQVIINELRPGGLISGARR